MHRLIMGLEDKKLVIDHINGNSLDNRKSNMRICDRGQNQWNSKKTSKATSPFKGVRKTSGGKFEARIKTRNITTNLGLFDNELDAARAYNKAARKQHGEYANINII